MSSCHSYMPETGPRCTRHRSAAPAPRCGGLTALMGARAAWRQRSSLLSDSSQAWHGIPAKLSLYTTSAAKCF